MRNTYGPLLVVPTPSHRGNLRFFAVFLVAAALTFSLSGCDALSEIMGGLGLGGGDESEDGKNPGNGDSPPSPAVPTPPAVLQPGDTVVEITGPGESGATTVWNPSVEGYYQIELWGSQGWNPTEDLAKQYGGRGAYVQGVLEITEEEKGQTLYVTVGMGTDPSKVPYNWGMGGGASDVRWGADTLYDRIIVAAGGGGSHDKSTSGLVNAAGYSIGGFGGGLTGGVANSGAPSGGGASQTAGGAAGGGSVKGKAGTFGTGALPNNTNESVGSGGYGYWGGGSGSHDSGNGGGGGSSFISGYEGCVAITGTITSENPITRDTAAKQGPDAATHYSEKVFVPSVTINGTAYTTEMISGNAAMPAPDGGTEIGHSGGGYARVVYLGKPST